MRGDFSALTGRTIINQFVGLFVFLLISLAVAGSVRAAQNPEAFVRDLGDRAVTVLAAPSLTVPERRAAFGRMLENHFDLDLISRFVLGRHWGRATASQRRTYRELFAAYLLATYGRRLESYAGETLEVGRAQDRGRQGVVVSSRLHRPQGAPISVVWRLKRAGETWRVVDLVVEGVSMLMAQRSEFDAVIRQGGGRVEPLLTELRAIVARLSGPDAIRASRL